MKYIYKSLEMDEFHGAGVMLLLQRIICNEDFFRQLERRTLQCNRFYTGNTFQQRITEKLEEMGQSKEERRRMLKKNSTKQ